MRKELEQTAIALSQYIRDCVEKGCSDKERELLPELTNSLAELAKVCKEI